jgi:uncharacterized protein
MSVKKSLLILAIAAACTSVQAQQNSSPAKKELIARIIKLQQPAVDNMARTLVQEQVVMLLERVEPALHQRVAPERRETVAKEIEADARKFSDETTSLVRDRATRLAPAAITPILEEKFTEDELKQVVAMLESPVLAKFQAAGLDIQKALGQKVVADTRPQVEQRYRSLEETIAKRLGISNGAAAARPAAPAASLPSGPAAGRK